MLGAYIHRVWSFGLTLAFVIVFVMALATQGTVNHQKKTLKKQDAVIRGQASVIDALVATATAQGRVNTAFLKALKRMSSGQNPTARYLAGTGG